jgi:hypothetical protein
MAHKVQCTTIACVINDNEPGAEININSPILRLTFNNKLLVNYFIETLFIQAPNINKVDLFLTY